ncbi:hypothetical protein D1872_331360 [compost metagenome]
MNALFSNSAKMSEMKVVAFEASGSISSKSVPGCVRVWDLRLSLRHGLKEFSPTL